MELHSFRERNTLIFLLFLILLFISTLAAQKEPHFEIYNIANGLSTQQVMVLFQDSQGYLWIGTTSGVNRNNGYERILEHFKDVAPNNTEEIVQHFKECGSAWVDDEIPEDDVTLVAVKLT